MNNKIIIAVILLWILGLFVINQTVYVGCVTVLGLEDKVVRVVAWKYPSYNTIVSYATELQKCPFTTRQCTWYMSTFLAGNMNNKEL